MKKLLILPVSALAMTAMTAMCAKLTPVPTYMNAADAEKERADFPLVGEYVSHSGKAALQANMQPDGSFLVAEYIGGLPGDGWDGTKIVSSLKTTGELKTVLNDFKKVERESPTLGKPAPENAILKFPNDISNVTNGVLIGEGVTTKDLSSFHLHLEFCMPFKPDRPLTNQDRGNSGVYIFNNYEIQVMDSFALDFNHPENNAIETLSQNNQWCGSFYKEKLPDVNMVYPPLRWQTYDIDFTAPVFDGKKKVKNARISVRHNGVLIHDDVELKTGTGAGAKRPQLAKGPIIFQGHKNKVMYRNIWATELN